MRGRKVQAGRSFISIDLEGSKRVEKGLRRLSARMQSIGRGMQSIGAAGIKAGGAIITAFGVASRVFAKTGDQLDKMAARTGISVEALSQLGFATEQSGQSIEQLESVLIGMTRQVRNFERGLSTAKDAFGDLGLSYEEIRDLSPEEQFLEIAERLSKIEDPTRRAGIAMQVFGRAGRNLIPLLSTGRDGIRQLTDEAERLGLTMSEEDATAAAILTDSLNRVWRQIRMVVVQVGAAVAGPFSDLLNWTTEYIGTSIKWLRNNREIVAAIAKFAGLAIAAGGAIAAMGISLQLTAFVLGGLATGLAAMTTALGFLLSPIGLVTAALAAGVTYFTLYTEAGQKMVADALAYLGDLGSIAGTTFEGIKNALLNGETEAAANIMWMGLAVIWERGVQPLRKVWGGIVTFLKNTWAAAITQVAGHWNGFTGGLQRGWRTTTDYLVGAADSVWTQLKMAMNSLVGFFERTWARIKGLFGSDAAAEIARINKEVQAANKQLRDDRQGRKSNREQDREQFNKDSLKRQRDVSKTLEKDLQRQFEQNQSKSDAALKAAEKRLAAARAELDRLGQEQADTAAKAATEGTKKAAENLPKKSDEPGRGGFGDSGAGVFNALAIASLAGVGGDASERAAEAAEETAANSKKTNELLEERTLFATA